jgi:hypothetical protein
MKAYSSDDPQYRGRVDGRNKGEYQNSNRHMTQNNCQHSRMLVSAAFDHCVPDSVQKRGEYHC